MWATVGASVAGTAHRARNTPCQDSHRWARFGPADDWLVVATSDGAGTATYAERGATLTCGELVRRVAELGPHNHADREAIVTLFADVRGALIAEAGRLEVPVRELACTTLFAVVGPDSAAFAQVGDGAIVVGDANERRVVFWPEPVGYANATDFLTDDGFADALCFDSFPERVAELALLTDGLQRLALDFADRTPHEAFFGPLFRAVRETADAEALAEPLRAFLDSPRVGDRTDDDKTLVIAARRHDPNAPSR